MLCTTQKNGSPHFYLLFSVNQDKISENAFRPPLYEAETLTFLFWCVLLHGHMFYLTQKIGNHWLDVKVIKTGQRSR